VPDSGRVLLDGHDILDLTLESLRANLALVSQEIVLFNDSIYANIAYGELASASEADIIAAAEAANAMEFIQHMPQGIHSPIGQGGGMLSGGQRQRLAIARALLTDPRILMLDDSTSAIDSATEDEIQKAIRRLLEGRTTLLITHRLSQIRWADRILVLRKGELVDSGTHEELLDRCDLYRRIFARYDSALPAASA